MVNSTSALYRTRDASITESFLTGAFANAAIPAIATAVGAGLDALGVTNNAAPVAAEVTLLASLYGIKMAFEKSTDIQRNKGFWRSESINGRTRFVSDIDHKMTAYYSKPAQMAGAATVFLGHLALAARLL